MGSRLFGYERSEASCEAEQRVGSTAHSKDKTDDESDFVAIRDP
jgi:hypothetical protein